MRSLNFDELQRQRVAQFYCGTESWEVDVADWIRKPLGEGGALDDLANPSFKLGVTLYETDSGELIGYGSLGESRWAFPDRATGKKMSLQIQIIPFVGLQKQFQGQPSGGLKNEQYSYQILGDLISRARARWQIDRSSTAPILGLCVDPRNARAIKFYENCGFIPHGTTKDGYLRMYVNIDHDEQPPI